jgi:hypothetical protein
MMCLRDALLRQVAALMSPSSAFNLRLEITSLNLSHQPHAKHQSRGDYATCGARAFSRLPIGLPAGARSSQIEPSA